MGDDGAREAEALKLVAWPALAGVTDSAATGAWSGVMAMSHGSLPALIEVPAVLVAVSMGVTESESRLTASAVDPSGVMAMALGLSPTGMAGPAVLVAVSMGVTVSSSSLAT